MNNNLTRRAILATAATGMALVAMPVLATTKSSDQLLNDYMNEWERRYYDETVETDEQVGANTDVMNEIADFMINIKADTLSGVENKARWLEMKDNFVGKDEYQTPFEMFQSMMTDIRRLGGVGGQQL